jgi:hypothetical protein
MLSRVNIDVKVNSLQNPRYFAKGQARETSFYLLGWGSPNNDAIYTLRTGEPSFPMYHTLGFWEWLAAHPGQSEWFNEDMRRRATTLIDGGLALYDWPHEGTVIDIGGGNGLMLERILRERPGVNGIVFDQPHVVVEARSLRRAGVSDRGGGRR